jgi:Ni,Fe-hydrogenase maturation factor
MNDRLKVFGLGNPYVRDDAIGLELVRLLSGVLSAVIAFREMPFPNISLLNEFVDGTKF